MLITEDQQPWCPEYDGEVRVSSLQTGLFAGPVGSSVGQHRFNPAAVVREAQRNVRLYTPQYGRIELRVADNGRGFAGDFNQLGRLFVRHARGSGSGVGLYISRQLAKRMNATLDFTRSKSGGFVAELNLPYVPQPVLAEQHEQKLA